MPESQALACNSGPGRVNCSIRSIVRQPGSAQTGKYSGSQAGEMWEFRHLADGAIARSSTAARTAGLREVTIRLPAPSATFLLYSQLGKENSTDMDMPAVSGAEIL